MFYHDFEQLEGFLRCGNNSFHKEYTLLYTMENSKYRDHNIRWMVSIWRENRSLHKCFSLKFER